MSGHSKWATIKRKKAATDAKRGKLFTRCLKEVEVAAKSGGNPDSNPRLRSAISAAKSAGVPSDTIDRAVKRGSGEDQGTQYEEITYEGYAPGGVAILVRTLTDNKNRTAAEVRHVFTKCNGNLASANAVAYLFKETGVLSIPKASVDEEKLYEVALDAGAKDINDDGEFWEVLVEPRQFQAVRESIESIVKDVEGEIRLVPETHVRVSGHEAEQVLRMMDLLDDLDDVQSVTGNFEIDDKEMESFSK
ncbi:MAG: YebC/PmpR family DNA-binding transcriptional regulator [SAR324 cluster bacterium]|uniref:Probable transcriptional regulatory protein GYA55_11350 n=1 Tax=SAR324 cluster bacterium TaxID=2024889 RepID=A0A7X9IK49_9DELT|nr:YebC/PmpR family DNA-binding transcriptional regulator [SAR324 cluster bacterium]